MARTVLLADDSVTAQNMGRRILTDAGYEVITVNNGSAALKKIHESRPDLIVLDVYMPGYGGLEVCQRLKESEATQRIPVLLTVGKMEPFKTEEAKRVHADGHIIKPFDASELLAALTKLEDRIVPQSENGRGRGKSEKKSRRWSVGEDPAKANDISRTDQIAYLQSAKNRQVFDAAEEKTTEQHETESLSEERDAPGHAVTFASGPIYEPSSAPEFPVQGESSSEHVSAQSAAQPPEERESQPKAEEPQTQPATAATEPARSEAAVEATAASSEQTGAASDEPAKVESGPRWIAETVAITPDEAACSLDEEMRRAQSGEESGAAAREAELPAAAADSGPQIVGESDRERVSADEQKTEAVAEEATEPEKSQGAAFAAAASGSGSAVSSQPVSTESAESKSPENSETAAAWDNWEKIRDSVVGPQLPESLVQSVTEMAQRSFAEEQPAQPEPASTSEPEASEQAKSAEEARPAEPAAQPASGDALSTIVDSVLAELKPRLLAEIAKQLSNDKK